MPQHSIWKTGQEAVGIRVEIEDLTPSMDVAMMTTVYVRRLDGDWTAFVAHRWSGDEMDYLHTYVASITEAWLFGTLKDVLARATKIRREAQAHAKAHGRT